MALKSHVQERLAALSRSDAVQKIASALGESAKLHLVGGTVRDAVLESEVKDFDCATKYYPEEVLKKLSAAGIHTVATGLKHQTVTAVPIEGEPGIEITTFRASGMSPAGGVRASETIEEDLRFRDFTLNALAFDVASSTIVDVTGGLDDISKRIIRAPEDPAERFAEDPLRVFRMIRFACMKGFSVDPKTYAAAAPFVPALANVSIERIREEFSKMLVSDSPSRGLEMLADLKILPLFFPEIETFLNFEQNEYHRDDLFVHTLKVVEATPKDLVLRLAALLHDVGKPPTLSVHPETGARRFFKHESVGGAMTREILKRLKYPNAVIDDVCILVETHMRPLEAGPGGMRRLIRDTGELFESWRILKEADAASCMADLSDLRSRLDTFDATIEEVKKGPQVSPLKSLAVNGTDLIAAGVPAGPKMGELLRALHERVLDNPELNTKEQLLALVPEVSSTL